MVVLPKSYIMFALGNKLPVNIPDPGTDKLPDIVSNVNPVLPVNSPLSSKMIWLLSELIAVPTSANIPFTSNSPSISIGTVNKPWKLSGT